MRQVGQRARELARGLIDVTIPVRCFGCEARTFTLCPGCCADLLALRVRVLDGGVDVLAASSYDAAMRDAILAYKDRGRRDLAEPLGWFLRAAIAAAGHDLDCPLLIPMPSTAAAIRRRGSDHLRRLAQFAAPDRPVALVLGARGGIDSVGLSASGRQLARRAGMFARRGAARLVRGRDVLLLDDIVTTGSTISRAAEIARDLGAARVVGAVVAETEKQVAPR